MTLRSVPGVFTFWGAFFQPGSTAMKRMYIVST